MTMTTILPIAENTSSFILKDFKDALKGYHLKLNAVTNSKELQRLILTDFLNFLTFYIEQADKTSNVDIDNTPPTEAITTYMFTYLVPEEVKNISILHQNVLLELQKTEVISKEDDLEISKIEKHYLASKNVLQASLLEFSQGLDTMSKKLEREKNAERKTIKKLQLHNSPWTVYKNQFETLQQQILSINSSKKQLLNAIENFNSLKEVVSDVHKKNSLLYKNLEEITTYLHKSFETKTEIHELLPYIDDRLIHLDTLGNNQQDFAADLHEEIGKLNSCNVYVAAEDGILQRREVSFSKTVQKWFDYKILPDFMDLIAQEDSVKAKMRVTLINLKNSIQHAKTNKSVHELDIFTTAVENLTETLQNYRKTGEALSDKINRKVSHELQVLKIYNAEAFLEVPINTTISSTLNLRTNSLYKALTRKGQQIDSFFSKKYEQSQYLESFSEIEVTTKCIAQRMLKEENEHYDILFLNKNFIGDLFLVPRELEERKIEESIKQWTAGFNKAVLVYGDRLSGRSTFLESIARHYFKKNVVTLKPNGIATIDGRKFATTYDLKEALDYIRNNNTKSTKPVILIDDIELWRDDEHNLLSNVRALLSFIGTASNDSFVMVATTGVMKDHLDHRLGFSNVFSTLVDVSEMEADEIFQALILRHGAAHRNLVTRNGEEVSIKKIEKAAARLSKKYRYNVGDVLQSWTYNTFVQEGEDVLYDPVENEFLDFFTKEECIILKQALLFKTISEFGLKRVTASGFDPRYKAAIRRLINTKVLLRGINGNLYINPVTLHDITSILTKKMYLTK